MPTYAYTCKSCDKPFERVLAMSDHSQPQSCPECGGESQRQLSEVGAVLQGDGWVGKNLRVKDQMARKNAALDRKQRANHHKPTLIPNVDGEQVKDWAEAKKLAASKGKDTSTYDPLIQR